MQNEDKILEVLSESLKRQDQMLAQMLEMNSKFDTTNVKLYSLEQHIGKVEEELVKLNLQTNENTRAIIKLADRLEQIIEHEKRISKLEAIVLK